MWDNMDKLNQNIQAQQNSIGQVLAQQQSIDRILHGLSQLIHPQPSLTSPEPTTAHSPRFSGTTPTSAPWHWSSAWWAALSGWMPPHSYTPSIFSLAAQTPTRS